MKLPDVVPTRVPAHETTLVAVASEVVSKVAEPLKSMSPVIGTAEAGWLNSPQVTTAVAAKPKIFALSVFMIVGSFLSVVKILLEERPKE